LSSRIEITIESLAAGGDGVGRSPDGRVVFVPFTAPGDRVRVRVETDRGRWLRASVETLIEPSPLRTDPLCEVFGACGGCAWQHLSYEAQLEAKRAILREALGRIGRLTVDAPIPFTASPVPYGYRTRARLLVARGRVGWRRRGSHAVCATRRCPILVPALDQALAELAAHPPRAEGEIELAAGEAGAVRVTALPPSGRGGPTLVLQVGADRIGVSPGGFTQANAALVTPLAAAVQEAAGTGALALELFAGAGTLTLGLARRFARVVALEGDADAALDLAANLRAAGLSNVEALAAPVERALEEPAIAGLRPEVVVLDPPRSGLPHGVADILVRRSPSRLVYLSCDPATLARDLGRFADAGWRLASLRGFDLFPQTPHVEALAVMERAEAEGGAGA